MQDFNWKTLLLLLTATPLLFTACIKEREIIQNIRYDNTIYQLDTVNLYSSGADKTKEKTPTQYLSILYTDLFQTTISADELNALNLIFTSVGDKTMTNEAIVFLFMNSNPIIPDNAAMRSNIPQFVNDTYIRFYQRKPTELEKSYLVNLIDEDISIDPESVYIAFALSDEYLFY